MGSLDKITKSARKWVAFCKRFLIEPTAPDIYFSQNSDYLRVKIQSSFVREGRAMQWDYKEKVPVNALGAKDQKSMSISHFPWSVCDVATVIIRELNNRGVFKMVQSHVKNVKSELKNIIKVFIATTYDNHKNVVHLAFEMVEKLAYKYNKHGRQNYHQWK